MNNIPANIFRNSRALLNPSGAPVTVTHDEPDPELKLGWIVILLFFGLFLGWAVLARLDSAAYAQGAITVFTMIIIVVNLVVDMLYAVVDPRISYR